MGFCSTARMVITVHRLLSRDPPFRVIVNDTDVHLGNAFLDALPRFKKFFPHLRLEDFIIINDICR
jgi:acetoin utilization deacetylase AcuC-like enzyme